MPRDSSGNYTLPAGNPVITGSTIASSWANNTLNDLATEMTDSLSRSGKGGMNAAFKITDGTVALPGLAFASEPGSGIYRIGAADIAFAVTGTEVLELQVGGIYAHQPFKATTSVSSIIVTGNGTGSVPDVLVNANSSNGLALRLAAASGAGISQSIVDGHSAQEWQFRVGSAGTGILDIFDSTASKSIVQIAPTTDTFTHNASVVINGVANLYGETIISSSTTNQGFGLLIKGGTSISDNAFAVQNQTGTVTNFEVRGDGFTLMADHAASPTLYEVGFRGSPPNVQSGAYTLVAADRGKSVVFTAAAALTLPQSVFSEGDMQVVVAQGGVVTITQGTGVTLTWANASNTTGNRTLTNVGIATLWWQSTTACYVTGSGLS